MVEVFSTGNSMPGFPKTIPISLLSFSTPSEPWPWDLDYKKSKNISVINVREDEIIEGCYGVKIEDDSMAPLLCPGMVAVFSQTGKHELAQGAIFSIGLKSEPPVVRKVVKNDMHPDAKNGGNSGQGRMRKSFMTPTPLHIPKSKISPIAESTHQMIYYKKLAEAEALTLLPAGDLLWMHPLVLILPGEERG